MEDKYLRVSQVGEFLRDLFASNDAFKNLYIVGEVSGFKITKGSAYFSLKDEDNTAKIDCSAFSIYRFSYVPKDGDQILVRATISYYPPYNRLSLIVSQIEPFGQGQLAIKLEQLRKKLEAQGYFSLDHKKPIPKYPKNVCVITSKTGAVIRDIIKTTRLVNKGINITVCDVLVQGKDAAASLVRALKRVDKLDYDVIIIGRGGGSFEDLMPFNDENLVYAIFDAKTPIISAVGHESDTSLSDYVADARAATPTAAAQMIAYNEEELKAYLDEIVYRFNKDLMNKFDNEYNKIKSLEHNLSYQYEMVYSKNYSKIESLDHRLRSNIISLIEKNYNKLDLYNEKIKNSTLNKINKGEYELKNILDKLSAYNPANVLKLGYFTVNRGKDIIKSAKDVKIDDVLELKTHDGKIKSKVIEVE